MYSFPAHIVPSSNVDSDSNVDEDIISLAKKVSSSVEGKMVRYSN